MSLRISDFSQLLDPIRKRIMLMIGRAVVQVVRDDTKLQELQLTALAGEVLGRSERFQQYGFTSVPQPGAEAIILFVGGIRSHGLVIAVDDRRYRLKALQGGEVALYDDLGKQVVLRRDGTLELIAPTIKLNATTAVLIDAPLVDIQQKGDYKAHTHTGVQAGPSNTGPVT